jgi:hypothetical protein
MIGRRGAGCIALVAAGILSVSSADAGYKKCIRKVIKQHKVISSVLPLEGLDARPSLSMMAETRILTKDEADDLVAAHPKIQKCRVNKIKEERADDVVVRVLKMTFSYFDQYYVVAVQGRANVGLVASYLVDAYEISDSSLDELSDSKRRASAANSAALFEQADRILNPPEPVRPPRPPSYYCRARGNNIFCDPN